MRLAECTELSADAALMLREVPYRSKSVLTLNVETSTSTHATVRVLSWDPFAEEELVEGVVAAEDTQRALYVAAWWLDDAAVVASIATHLDPAGARPKLSLDAKWRPLEPTDLRSMVEARFGPLGFDPCPAALGPTLVVEPGCRACAGERFELPVGLELAHPKFCEPHREQATARLDKVRGLTASNQEAWRYWMIAYAAARLPHLPYPARRAFLDLWYDELPLTGDGLVTSAERLLAVLDGVASPDDLDDVLFDLEVDVDAFDDWSATVAFRLGLEEHFELAREVIAALDRGDPERSANRRGELAVQLSNAKRDAEARAEIAHALAAPGGDALTEIFAGNVDANAGDTDAAAAWYRKAIDTARQAPELGPDLELDAWWHLEELAQVTDDSELAAEARGKIEGLRGERMGRRAEYAAPMRRADVEQWGHRVGRNDPCPCGSGRKYKACHARH